MLKKISNFWQQLHNSKAAKKFTSKKLRWIVPLLIIIIVYLNLLPDNLFKKPYATVLEAEDGQLLGAKISEDGQWRFPPADEVPERYAQSLIAFEDQYFYYHPGFNPVSLAKALLKNIKAKKILGGGSTISMQVIRMYRDNPKRTILEKLYEIILATRLELSFSKKSILNLYASNAPFGGNVVGIGAASWRYFGKSAEQLSWAEAATLAVLPNSPALIHPGKNRQKLIEKRNNLLEKLFRKRTIDSTTFLIACAEPLPEKPLPLPQIAPHLLNRAIKEGFKEKIIHSTIDASLQNQILQIVNYHKPYLKANDINNVAIIVLDVETGNVLSYIGNIQDSEHPEHNGDVDVIAAPRSTGSILKPFLFAGMIQDGLLLPTTLVPDIPTQIAGYMPQNYNKTYDGAVPAKQALARSLNVPAVRMLQTYGIEKFNFLLKRLGMTTLKKSPDHYGLSIILGGAEGNLWDLTGIYASMARTLAHFRQFDGKYNAADFHPPKYINIENKNKISLSENSVLNAATIWATFEAMVEVSRPDEDRMWKNFLSSRRVAWKTGTSFGNRDAWAIGLTSDRVVGVWVGNADGEGRPNLTGLTVAAPILFDVFKLTKPKPWFDKPYDEMLKIAVCRKSGYRASNICDEIDSVWVPVQALKTKACPYHQLVHLDVSGKYRVHGNCERIENMQHIAWFVLPPSMEWYYRYKNPTYKILPPMRNDCLNEQSGLKTMEIIYPKNQSKIYVPIEMDGTEGSTIFEVAHRQANAIIFWHLDGEFIGTTQTFHKMALTPKAGKHTLILVDENGERLSREFEILRK